MLMGLDIGGTKCAVTVGDACGNVLEKVRFATSPMVAETLEQLTGTAQELLRRHTVTACGISCGGPLDEQQGVVLSPPNLPGWNRVPLTERMQQALGIPCALRNDANACAMAEFYFGAGRGCENLIFLTFGTGLGAGLILNGRLYSGTNGNAGEVGHIRLAPFGPAGYGKCGSFEGFCSGSGISALAREVRREALQRGEAVDWDCDARAVAEAARAGDANARAVFALSGRKLGEGLALLIDLFNPEKILIGSVFLRCEDLLRPEMERAIAAEALPAAAAVCRIETPGLGESIGDAAALAVAKELWERIQNQ